MALFHGILHQRIRERDQQQRLKDLPRSDTNTENMKERRGHSVVERPVSEAYSQDAAKPHNFMQVNQEGDDPNHFSRQILTTLQPLIDENKPEQLRKHGDNAQHSAPPLQAEPGIFEIKEHYGACQSGAEIDTH